ERLRLLRHGLLGLRRVAQPAPRAQGGTGASEGADHAMTRCGVVALAGKPNVGKSTLLNALVGEHLAIVSPKPQSTRLPVVGLLTRDDAQFIFTDSPGLLEPEYKLHETMRAAALRAIADAEVIAYLHPLTDFPAPPLKEVAKLDRAPRAPIVTVYTKSDVASTSPNLPQPPQPPPTSRLLVSPLPGSGWGTRDEARARPARDSRVPQVQRPTRAPHGARRSAGVSHLPPDLRRRRRHPHHADR